MMRVVWVQHVNVVILQEVDGDGSIMVLGQAMPQELDVLMNTKLANLLDLKDGVDLVDEALVR